jgi:hypothetical protein
MRLHPPDHGGCLALSRPAGLAASASGDCVCVDTFRKAAQGMARFAPLCPFTTWAGNPFPVPGLPGQRANSVEGVWQGLKLVDGRTDLDQLAGTPHKRPPDHLRTGGYDYRSATFRYGTREIDLLTARLAIYLPTYLYLLDRLVPDAVHDELNGAVEAGRIIVFYDWDSNMDIADDRSSFSHSAVLAAWFSGRLEPLLRRWADCQALLTGQQPTVTLRRYHPGAVAR